MKAASRSSRRLLALLLGLLPGVQSGPLAAAPDAADDENQRILAQADTARGNVAGIVWTLEMITEGEQDHESREYRVWARGHDARVETLQPRKIRDQRLLLTHGNMWFFKPGLSKPVPISKRQRLLGQASYGDIAATNYAQDYTAQRLPDAAWQGEDCYVFDLRSRNPRRTTYDGIQYWVSRERLVGVHARYFTVSGKLFKSADMRYEHLVGDGAQAFVSAITIRDELIGGATTVMNFSAPSLEELDDARFDLNLFTH